MFRPQETSRRAPRKKHQSAAELRIWLRSLRVGLQDVSEEESLSVSPLSPFSRSPSLSDGFPPSRLAPLEELSSLEFIQNARQLRFARRLALTEDEATLASLAALLDRSVSYFCDELQEVIETEVRTIDLERLRWLEGGRFEKNMRTNKELKMSSTRPSRE